MPDEPIDVEPQDGPLLDAICEKYGLESREQAMEFLLRRRIRQGSTGLTGRGRALYDVKGDHR